MVVALRSMACHQCRQSVLRTFIRGLGGRTVTQHSSFSPLLQQPFARSWKSSYSDASESVLINELPLNDINDGFRRPKAFDEPASEEKIAEDNPEEALQEDNPLSNRQRLPELPDSPPTLLAPLLERVSIDLGMDDLSLLDLRLLDPPPALGANLLMIIGTARSEKHLHVSADRLCRWLRTEHQLSPFADGLLGRNELKLKLRRKAKRSRLLSAVGAKSTADTDIDDGIRTGWVCVNVGRVDGGELPETAEKLQRAEGVVGFGARVGGCSIVVQMLTEEKRGQMDLEKLWTGIMSRAKREKDKADLEDEREVPDSNVLGNPTPRVIDGGRPLGDGVYRSQVLVTQSRPESTIRFQSMDQISASIRRG
nr:atpase synthesis protein 25, mitochondrial [Quercus suber]